MRDLKFVVTTLLAAAATVLPAISAPGNGVELRSGLIGPDRQMTSSGSSEMQRLVVRFTRPVGWFERGRLETAGAVIEAPLSSQAYLVSLPAGRSVALAATPGVDWVAPFQPGDKLAPEIADIGPGFQGGDIVVLLHLFRDADPNEVASRLSASGLQVEGVGSGNRFGRIVLQMSPEQVVNRRDDIAAMDELFWLSRRHRRVLANNDTIWVAQSGLDAGETTPVFDQGIYGEGQIAAVLDTGIDADMCYFQDGVLGLPPTNTAGGTAVDNNQRKIIAVDFLDPSEDPANLLHWDTQNHGSHVAGILAGDDLLTPVLHDDGDGMAPGAKLVIQDAGYAADNCGDLPGIGCPVTDLIPVFQQAYDQGARTHNNSWNDNENAAVQNTYTDASEDVDEFIWNHPDFLIFFGAGNATFGGGGSTIGSPGTSKNGISVGSTYYNQYAANMADFSSWGPTDDGRYKPDIMFPGQGIHSAANDFDAGSGNCGTQAMGGTSMASPGAAGMSILIRDYFEQGFYPTGAPVPADSFTAGGALVKAMLINSGVSLLWDNDGNQITLPSYSQGWGRILLDNVLHFAGDGRGLFVDDHASGFVSPSDAPVRYQMEVLNGDVPLKVSLVWHDFPSTPAASIHLINDLDLRVDGATGTFHGNHFLFGESADLGQPDRLNNVEVVLVKDPKPGVYVIEVAPHAIPFGPQPYALVVSGNVAVTTGPRPAYMTHIVDDTGPNGNGDGVLDPGETALISVTMLNSGDIDATAVSAEMYSVHPELFAVYDSEASFPDIPVSAQATSLAPHFSVTMQPDAVCGQRLGAGMQVAGNGFTVDTAFTVETGVYEANISDTDTPLTIPRGGTLYAYIDVPASFPLTDVDVSVDVDINDNANLELVLNTPGAVGPPVYLHNNSGAGSSGIVTTYDDLTEPDGPGDLAEFIGRDPQGAWSLRINNIGNKTGTLNSWTLHLKGSTPWNCNPVGCADPVPNAVGDNLTVDKSGAADIQISWNAATGATEYNVWRARDNQFQTGTLAGSTGSTSLVDTGAQNLSGAHYYLVRSVNSCRWESP